MSLLPPPSGVWHRTTFLVDEVDMSTQPAVWIQTPSGPFLDVRPEMGDLLTASCFAGLAYWEPPRMKWVHSVDLWRSMPVDVGDCDLDGDVLTEYGSFTDESGVEVHYVERWERSGDAGEIAYWDPPAGSVGAAIRVDRVLGVIAGGGGVLVDLADGSVIVGSGEPPDIACAGAALVVDGVDWAATDSPTWPTID
jgi:hypothetical protein